MTLELLLWVAAACLPVRGPLVHARDLAAVDAQFAVVPTDAIVGYSPVPGARRVFSGAEIGRFGKRFGFETQAREACFEYAMEALDRTTVQAAMEQLLPGAAVEIVDTGTLMVPEGRIVFAVSALAKPPQSRPDEPVVWRGYVEYGEGLKFSIWAKVRITMSGQRLVAIKDIAVGQEIQSADLATREVRGYPGSERWVEKADDVVGHRALRLLRTDAAIPIGAVDGGKQAVARGDSVTVAVESGAARLSIDARAESGAEVGETVKLRNPKSGKIFEARVTAKHAAIVIAPVTSAGVQK